MKLGKKRKLRILIDGVGLFLTVDQIDAVFCTTKHLNAVKTVLDKIETERCRGMGTTIDDINVQIDLL